MRFGLWLHIAAWLVVVASAVELRAAVDAAAGVPDHAAGPPAFAVTPFQNRVPNGRALDWIAIEAPFEIAEKTQGVLGLAATDSPLFVPNSPVIAAPEPVAEFARQRRAEFVVTGWFDRVGQDLRMAVVVWRVDRNSGARVVGEARGQGPQRMYHAILGNAAADAWTRAGRKVDGAARQRFGRALSTDNYPVFTLGRGLGHFVAGDLVNAERDLERTVFLDPKLFAAQRLLGELYLRSGEVKDIARAAAKFNYALELAAEDVESLRAAAGAAIAMRQWDRALELWTAVVTRRPWDIDARFQFGRTHWKLGHVDVAERQLAQVVAHQPDHLAARHVLVLIHGSRSDTKRLAVELEVIALLAPHDLAVKSDLAAAYGALGRWDQAALVLEALATARPADFAVLVRLGDVQRKRGDIDAAIAWYRAAARVHPDTSLPGFMIGQAQMDAGRFAAAAATYADLRRYAEDGAASEHALGVIAFAGRRFDDAVLHFRRAIQGAPRSLEVRRGMIAAELERKDVRAAWQHLEAALREWPDDGVLHYLAGLASRLSGDTARAHRELHYALEAKVPEARLALDAIATGSVPRVNWRPALIRPWGDGEDLAAELERFAAIRGEMAAARADYQSDFIAVLGMLGKGPAAQRTVARGCPARRVAPRWMAAQAHLKRYQRFGVDLEASFRRIVRHDALGLTARLLPTARLAVAEVKRDYKLALEDIADLRAQWSVGLAPELAVVGCTAKTLAAVGKDSWPAPRDDDEVKQPIRNPAPLPQARSATFFVDNSGCSEPVEVYLDDQLIGRARAGQRSAWTVEGGERSLCLILPRAAQCGDRGTVRRVYLHDGWTVTMRCRKGPSEEGS